VWEAKEPSVRGKKVNPYGAEGSVSPTTMKKELSRDSAQCPQQILLSFFSS
jgi:hypothetical protein